MLTYSTSLLRKIKAHIQQGGIIAYPTEFCFGLGCDPFNYRAIKQLLRLKVRNPNKGLIVVAGNLLQLKQIVKYSVSDERAFKHYWPGQNSLILPVNKHGCSTRSILGQQNRVAVRVTNHSLVVQLCKYLHLPLVSTSANKALATPSKNYAECVRRFGKQVMCLPGTTSFARQPSRIIDWATKQTLR